MIKDMVLEQDKTTKIHVMKLEDGSVQTFDTEEWSISLHVANSYLEEDGTLVMEAQAFTNKDNNPFATVLFERLDDVNKLTEQAYGSKFRKFSMNLQQGTVKI